MNSQSSRCGKNAASVAGRKGHRKRAAGKEKTQHLSECWVCWLPPGRQKERYKTNSSSERLLLCGSSFTHVAPELAQGVGFDLTDTLGRYAVLVRQLMKRGLVV